MSTVQTVATTAATPAASDSSRGYARYPLPAGPDTRVKINRVSVGTKNKSLKLGVDGSLTIYVQAEAPADEPGRADWLPAPKGDFSHCFRTYWPKESATDGSWTPRPVHEVK